MGVRNGRDRADTVPTSTVHDRRRTRRPPRGSGMPGPLLIVGLPQLPVVPRDGPAGLQVELAAVEPTGTARYGDQLLPGDATGDDGHHLGTVPFDEGEVGAGRVVT